MDSEKMEHMKVLAEEVENGGQSNEPDNKDAVCLTPEDAAREKRLRWKLDLTILPLLAMIYFLSTTVSILVQHPYRELTDLETGTIRSCERKHCRIEQKLASIST